VRDILRATEPTQTVRAAGVGAGRCHLLGMGRGVPDRLAPTSAGLATRPNNKLTGPAANPVSSTGKQVSAGI